MQVQPIYYNYSGLSIPPSLAMFRVFPTLVQDVGFVLSYESLSESDPVLSIGVLVQIT